MAGRVNKSPLCAREGKIYIDGALVADSCKFQLYVTPKVWEGKTLSEKGTNRRLIISRPARHRSLKFRESARISIPTITTKTKVIPLLRLAA